MNTTELVELAKRQGYFFMGTSRDNIPHVRAMQMVHVDESGVFFYSRRHKPVCRQIIKNPSVELCFYDAESTTQVRLSGIAESLDNDTDRKKLLELNPGAQRFVDKEGLNVIMPFKIEQASAKTICLDTGVEEEWDQVFSARCRDARRPTS